MEKITYPIRLNMRQESVAALHRALLVFDFKIDIDEQTEQRFGKSTRKAVLEFQRKHGLEPSGVVDKKTAALFNKELSYAVSKECIVKGLISTDGKRLPAELTVQIIDQHVLDETIVATITVDIDGKYEKALSFNSLESPALRAKVVDQKGNLLASSATVYTISDPLRFDMFIPAANIKKSPEFSEITSEVKRLVRDKNIGDLTLQQMELISGKTRLSSSDLQLYQKAYQLAQPDKISSEILYGLFRKGLPTRLSSLYEQGSLDLSRLIAEAVQENIIAPQDEQHVAKSVAKIQRYAIKEVLNEPLLIGGPTFHELLNLSDVSETVTHKFIEVMQAHTGTVEALWSDLDDGLSGVSPKDAADLKFSIQAGSLSLGHLPLAKHILKLRKNMPNFQIEDLAGWNQDQWDTFLDKAETETPGIIPDRVPGETPSKKRSAYGRAMSRILEQSYPTKFLSAKIDADDGATATLKSFSTFVNANGAFRLGETDIGAYLKKNKDALKGIDDPEKFTKELKTLHLQYMLSPGFDRYESIKILQAMKIVSSASVVDKGWKQFSREYMANGGSQAMAGIVFEMAGHNVAMMQNLQFVYGSDVNLGTYVTGNFNFGIYFENLFDNDPNLETLFGSQDFCSCKHCRSIYGPGAYMVDILQFLHTAETNKTRFDTCLEVLFDRRPDLCHIDLNCDNAKVALPYIDLINEVFENAIYKQTSGHTPDYSSYQTTGTSEELLAHPEHIQKEVYNNALKSASYPWKLPFDLWTESGRIYLDHLKLPRHKIMDALLPDSSEDAFLTDETAVNELLQLGKTDREIILGSTTVTHKKQWGLNSGANLVNTLKKPDTLLAYSGLDYDDLKTLLKTWFVNPDATLEIVFDSEHDCELAEASIRNLTENTLMGILRFTRLKNKLGWSIRELDMALRAFNAVSITSDVLLKLSHVLRLKEYIKLPLHQIFTFWGLIFTGHRNDEENERSPYELLFLNKSVINPVDTAFELNAGLSNLADPTKSLKAHAATIQAGFGISSTDMDMLVTEVLLNDKLNLANLSNLYRHVILAKAMRLKIEELIALISISGMDPFAMEHTDTIITFLTNYRKIKKAKFNVAELRYLLKNDYDIAYGKGLSEDAISDALTDMHLGLKKIQFENQFTADPKGEITTGKLAAVLSEEDLKTTLAIVEKTSLLDLPNQTAFVSNTLGIFLKDSTDAVSQLVDPLSSLTDQQSRYEYILKDLLDYLVQTGAKEFLKQKIASNMGLNVDVADELLFVRIKGPDDPVKLSGITLQDPAFITTENESIKKEAFPHQFNTYVLLHKTALILRKFKITSHELDYLFAEAFSPSLPGWPGWFTFNDLPVIAIGNPAVLYKQLLRCCDLFSFYRRLPQSDQDFFELMKDAFDPGSTTTLQELLENISEITKWDLNDLKELSQNVFGFTKFSYLDEIPFLRLHVCMEIIKLTGASAVDLNTWTAAELSSNISNSIVHSVKSRYNEKEWLGIARPLRNQLRERQRSALVDWLVNHQPGINNMFELYSYYLVDPEMSACMLTSRIRLALSAIQLFVQRCLINLEKEVDIKNDDLEHWDQWKWMKNYRLWEANRKIFCYPENWIEPELRNNKSSFFKELEQELSQSEVNMESVENAYLNYLNKLEAVSHLDIMGICRAEEKIAIHDAYYVFGRTTGTPRLLYFRKYTTEKTWTPWEKIEIDFEGDHLIPIVYNNKLYIFWPVFTTKTQEADIPGAGKKGSEPPKYREIQMAWSVYSNGKWSAKRVTEETIDELKNDKYAADAGGNQVQQKDGTKRYFVAKHLDSNNRLKLEVYARWVNDYSSKDFAQIGTFSFNPSMKVSITNTTNERKNLDTIDNSHVINQEYVESKKYSSNALTINNGIKIFKKTPSDLFSVTFADNWSGNMGVLNFILQPFFYQDNDRTFFIKWFSKFKISNHYHPYAGDFMNVINAKGVEGLLNPEYDASDSDALSNRLRRQQATDDFFTSSYGSRTTDVDEKTPIDEIDFSLEGAYSIYNWELFFHIPMLIAGKLWLDQKFSEAQKWYHYIFDPTDTSTDYLIPQRFWKLKPFVEIYDEATDGTPASIQKLMKLLNEGDADMEAQVEAWRQDPFNPHLVAQMRISAYQKNVVMKYIDNLMAWADMLFKQDTMETTNEAAQLYMLAWYILGEEPQMVEGKEPEERTYCELQQEGLDDFSNAMVALESKLIKYFGKRYQAGFDKFKDYLLRPQKNYTDDGLYAKDKLWFGVAGMQNKSGAVVPAIPLNSTEGHSEVLATVNTPHYNISNVGYSVGSNDGLMMNKSLSWSANELTGCESIVSNAYWKKDKLFTHVHWDRPIIYQVVKTLYFCIPHNDMLLKYWDTVEDRMFKLRNCMNIEGVIRQLPLFEPPIDPAMLVKAAASGMDLSSALNDLNASLPNYRFSAMIAKAKEFTSVVKSAGSLLLSVLEKKDAEAMALLRSRNEICLLEAIKQIKKYQLEEAQQNRNALQESWNMINDKYDEYENRDEYNVAEGFQIGLMGGGIVLQIISQILDITAAATHQIPQFTVGAAGWAGSPVALVSTGGNNVGNSASSWAAGLNGLAGTLYQGASLSGIIANIQRRQDDWDHLADQAEIELKMVEAQQEVALTRWKISQAEIDNHGKQIEQRKAEYEHLKSKFTNKELYDWMTGQVSSLYFQAYQMAYDLAKRAERSFRYEFPDTNDTFVSYGYWDSLKKGLLAGEKLESDLMRMEAAYLEKNKRTYEISKHVSLGMMDQFALMQLRENGKCYFALPEEIFDLDHPGHYMRRIKSVSLTIPCIAGPYSGVNAKLTLLSNTIRKTTTVDSEDPSSYPQKKDGTEDRFIDNLAMVQSIATSSAQNDSGLFTFDFGDERYLPFEGAGVISSWRLELPETFRSFDYNTINDVILTVNYTSKDGGNILRKSAEYHLLEFTQNSAEAPLSRIFSIKNEFADAWHRFLHPGSDDDGQQVIFDLQKLHFPYMFQKDIIHVMTLDLILQLKNPALYSNTNKLNLLLTLPESGATTIELTSNTSPSSELYLNAQPVSLNVASPFTISKDDVSVSLEATEVNIQTIPEELVVDVNSHYRLNKEEIENVFAIIHYYTESADVV